VYRVYISATFIVTTKHNKGMFGVCGLGHVSEKFGGMSRCVYVKCVCVPGDDWLLLVLIAETNM